MFVPHTSDDREAMKNAIGIKSLDELFQAVPFAAQLWIEHRAGEPLPDLPGMHTRRYGDTALAFIPAPEAP